MPLTENMLLGSGKNTARQRTNEPKVMHLQFSYYKKRAPIGNVEVKNTKSAGCAGFTQLVTKLLQHLDIM